MKRGSLILRRLACGVLFIPTALVCVVIAGIAVVTMVLELTTRWLLGMEWTDKFIADHILDFAWGMMAAIFILGGSN